MKKLFSILSLMILFILGMIFYSCGEEDDNIVTSSPNEKIKINSTNSSGEVTFESTGDEVTIKIVDSSSSKPLQNIEVTYLDEEKFKLFSAYDPSGNYLPSKAIFSHNSRHQIEMGKAGGGIYTISIIKDEETGKAVWEWESKSPAAWAEEVYLDTVDYEENIKIHERVTALIDLMWEGIMYFLAVNFLLVHLIF